MKEAVEDEGNVRLGQGLRRLEAQLEIRIARAILGKRLELHQQRRHQVEGDPHAGKLPQQRGHAVVVLERVKPGPREDVLVGDEILVIRLVHVPQEGDASHTL